MRDEFKIQRQGKTYVLFAGLLDQAHQEGLSGIDTEILQAPTPENGNVAICKATVTMGTERTFTGIGDASPANTSGQMAKRLVAMAETRSKARSLRDALNIGATALEELSDHQAEEEAPPPALPQEMRGAAKNANPKMAGKSQVDILRVMAKDLRGEDGPARLEARIGRPLDELTFDEANDWIGRLSPDGEAVPQAEIG